MCQLVGVLVHMCQLEVGEFRFICVRLKLESLGSYVSACWSFGSHVSA